VVDLERGSTARAFSGKGWHMPMSSESSIRL
jgi:hypothetical protein